LPEQVILERLESISIKGRERKPIHFHRFRNKRGLIQPDTHGSFCLPVRGRTQTGKLTFAKPISGPLALGFGCHYRLGMFNSQG
jgi:CRISPR-associated protein Csb2